LKVLITGGAGFIGSNVADRFIEDGSEVVIVDDLSNGKEENINKEAKFYRCDIRDKQIPNIFEKERPQIVIHNAAQISVRISVEDPASDADINIIGALNILEACKKYKVGKVIFASSGGTVYGEQQYFPADESHPLCPISPYGVAKLTTEKYLYYYHYSFGLNYISLRYGNIYGPRQDPYGEAGVVAIFCNKMISGKNPTINGDGRQTRDYVYIRDVVEANVAAAGSDFIGEINIGTGKETDVVELFNVIKNISGNNSIKEIHGPSKEGEQRRGSLSHKKAEDIIGWQPKVKIEEGLKLTYGWFKSKRG